MLKKTNLFMFASFGAVLMLAGWGSARAEATSPASEVAASVSVAAGGTTASNATAAAIPAARKAGKPRPGASSGLSQGSSSPSSGIIQNKCKQFSSTTSFKCKDAGNFASTCATATCGEGYTLTGGGGACAAGNRTIKSLSPNLSKGEFSIMCEKQGVKPQAKAICCKL